RAGRRDHARQDVRPAGGAAAEGGPVSAPAALTRAAPGTGSDGDTLTSTALIDPDDPVLAGHYPGFPVFPGVGLIELVDHTLRASGVDLVLGEIVSARFLSPVLPGDLLTVAATLRGADCAVVI